jgi:hypothetical protein
VDIEDRGEGQVGRRDPLGSDSSATWLMGERWSDDGGESCHVCWT